MNLHTRVAKAPLPLTTGIVVPGRERVSMRWILPAANDPRLPFALILTAYAVLGCTVLHFNRNPGQIFLTVVSACLLDMALNYLLRGRRLLLPISAYITGVSLAL